jgi:hypothetical protein
MLFTQENQVAIALAPDADRYNGNPATDVFNLALYGHICFILQEGAGGTGTVKLQVEQCTDISGGGATAVAFNYRVCSSGDTWGDITASASTGYTTAAGANKQVAIEVDARALSHGYQYVRLQLTEVTNDPCDAGIVAVLSRPRHAYGTLPSSIV